VSTDTKVKKRSPKTAFHCFGEDNDDWAGRQPQRLGVIRCPDGDRGEHDRLLRELLSTLGLTAPGFERGDTWGPDITLAEPVWEWLRINPCACGDCPWVLGRADGPGNFRGVVVTEYVAPKSAGVKS